MQHVSKVGWPETDLGCQLEEKYPKQMYHFQCLRILVRFAEFPYTFLLSKRTSESCYEKYPDLLHFFYFCERHQKQNLMSNSFADPKIMQKPLGQ